MRTDTTTLAAGIPLDPGLLARCRDRAVGHDRDNTFPHADLEELAAAGYLLAAVPTELGGGGLDLDQLASFQRTLARHAPATALALSTTSARRVGGGWVIDGRKQFGSLSPVWSRLGFHAMAAEHPGGPVIVHGFIDRDAPGVEVVETWDALGMRPTQSHDTVLEGVFVPDERFGAVVPAGVTDHPFTGTILVWALALIANVYTGIAERAFELAVDSARTRTSIGLERRTMATNPMIQHRAAEMYLELDALRAQVDRLTADWVGGVDHGPAWAVQVLSAKWRAAESAKRIVDVALDVVGGASLRRGHELERLYRDVRCGGFHPGTDAFTHEAVGKAVLGVEPQPRW